MIYFGGYVNINGTHADFNDKVFEYRNLRWTELGNLARPRAGYQFNSIKMNDNIFLIGGQT